MTSLHPCHDLQAPHHDAFERVAVGLPAFDSDITTDFQRRILGTLLHRGLIVHNASGYYVPAAAGKQWCAWCNEQEPST